MKITDVYILEDRGIIYVNGPDSSEFLQNLVSNDINKVNENMSCFASLLTPQGKYLYDFIIVKHKNGYLIDVEKKSLNELLNKLLTYKLRSKIEILNLTNEFAVAAISYEKFLSFESAKEKLGYTLKFRDDPIFLDPRHKDLGGRIIINLEKLYMSLKKMNLKTKKIENYYKISHKIGIPQVSTNKLQNKLFGIECNLEELNGLDFKKGCYVGQENTARIKLKNKLSKRLLPIQLIEGELNEEIIKYNDQEIGRVLIKNKFPFASIKYLNENFNEKNEFNCGNAKVKIIKPSWIK